MPFYYHGPIALKGRSETGKAIKLNRRKRKMELGREPAMTSIGERKLKKIRAKGGNEKFRLLQDNEVNLVVGKGIVKKAKLIDVVENPSDIKLSRKKVITKGTIIKTDLGKAVITSRPGQDGVLNAILIEEKAS
jgi:SSU ribosomal protein S8E